MRDLGHFSVMIATGSQLNALLERAITRFGRNDDFFSGVCRVRSDAVKASQSLACLRAMLLFGTSFVDFRQAGMAYLPLARAIEMRPIARDATWAKPRA